MSKATINKNDTKGKDFQWPGSKLSLDMATHDDGTPVLQMFFRIRVPLNESTMERNISKAREVANAIADGLVELPAIDGLKVHVGKPLKD